MISRVILKADSIPVPLDIETTQHPYPNTDRTILVKIEDPNPGHISAWSRVIGPAVDGAIVQSFKEDVGWQKLSGLNIDVQAPTSSRNTAIAFYLADGLSTFIHTAPSATHALCGGELISKDYLKNPAWIQGEPRAFCMARMMVVPRGWETPYSLGVNLWDYTHNEFNGIYIDPKIKNN